MKNKNQYFSSRWSPFLILGMVFVVLGILHSISLFLNPTEGILEQWFIPLITGYSFSILLFLLGVLFLFIAKSKYIRKMEILKRRSILAKRAAKEMEFRSGPNITVIGGGTGLSTILRGLKNITYNCNAIVTVTDDGGSSGRLISGSREALPPGDIRNCLVALSPREGTLEQLFNYRLQEPAELRGHCLGNLLISGLAEKEGDMAAAVGEIGRILNIRGKVIPVTMDKVVLAAKMEDGTILQGETTIVHDQRSIKAVYLNPESTLVNADAIDVIMAADIILLGPGSLYTSIIPNLLVPGIIDALNQSPAPVYYVANMMTQKGETDFYNLSDHLEAIVGLSSKPFMDGIILNTAPISKEMLKKYEEQGLGPVEEDQRMIDALALKVVKLPLVKEDKIVKHDAEVLARFIAKGNF